jgi:hypothetical protein
MIRSMQTLVLIAAITVAFMLNGTASAQSKGMGRSLDQQLLDDLDRELLKGLPGTKSTPSPPTRSENPALEAIGKSENPMANLAERMRGVQNRIARRDTSPATQSEQSQILSALDALLEGANQSRQTAGSKGGGAQAGAGSGAETAGPPRDSTNRIERGEKQSTETVDAKDVLRRIWGHLPDKLRDEMQASFSEQFLPKYERLIEEYYKRLAEERPTGP